MVESRRRQFLRRVAGAAAVIPFGFAGAAGQPSRPSVQVYKTPTCGCCEKWVTHMRAAGFPVSVKDLDDVTALKDQLKVPAAARSCHTAKVGSYFLEGHVPADLVIRLLATRPRGRGLAVAGMPIGSPGMEVEGVAAQAFDVLLVHEDGTISVFASQPAGGAGKAPSTKGPFVGTGIIKSVSRSTVKIAHEPIAAIAWPAMTMDFKLAKDDLRTGLAPGVKVEFTFINANEPVVSAIKVLR